MAAVACIPLCCKPVLNNTRLRLVSSTSHLFRSHSHWRGGFFDGYGSMFLQRYGRTIVNVGPAIGISASISDEAYTTLLEFQEVYGGKVYEYHGNVSAMRRPVYSWRVNGTAIFPALNSLLVSGLCIKRPQAELLLSCQHLFAGRLRRGLRWSDAERVARENLRNQLYETRAQNLMDSTTESYKARLLSACPQPDDKHAYAAGIFDADGCFRCVKDRTRYSYVLTLSQKKFSFLEAFKEVVLKGAGGKVATGKRDGVSSLSLYSRAQVLQLCQAMYPFLINKKKQAEIILTQPPSAEVKALIASMHGNQGKSASAAVVG